MVKLSPHKGRKCFPFKKEETIGRNEKRKKQYVLWCCCRLFTVDTRYSYMYSVKLHGVVQSGKF